MEVSTTDSSVIFSAAAYPTSVPIMDTSDEGSLRDVDSDDKLDSQALFKSLVTQVEEVIPVDIPSRKAIKSRKGFCCLSGGGQAMESPEKESPERPTAGLSSLVRDEFTRSLVPAGNSSPRRSPPRHHPVLGPLPPLPLDNLIGEQEGPLQGKKCLVLDLDETLVHSSFKPLPNPDFIIPVEIEGHLLDVYVIKRPHVDEFMKWLSDRFEVVMFTASLAKYADPLLDLLDVHNVIHWRLFREHCVYFGGSYVKDLEALGRDMGGTIIVDNSPHSYLFHPENAVPISSFIYDPEDQELMDLIPYLDALHKAQDIRPILAEFVTQCCD
jgi:RNA polymerase II subunit A small phosphatase-like protein